MRTQVLLVEPDDVGGLYPFTTTHCAWEIRVGANTLLERWQRSLPTCSVTVASHRDVHFRSFVERYPDTASYRQSPTLIVAGNLVVSPTVMRQIAEVCDASTQPMVFYCDGQPVAAFTAMAPTSPDAAAAVFELAEVADTRYIEITGRVITRMWQTFDLIEHAIQWDVTLLEHTIDDEAVIHPSVVIDEGQGPVIILEHATIEPFSYLKGPLVIGTNSVVNAHSSLKRTIVGPQCKVGGEIFETVFHGHSNKQHEGFVGNSYIGEWCNLGAGTTTSNLKNTYGEIRAHMPWMVENTGRAFLGSLIADHVKVGIGTLLASGCVVGPCCSIVAQDTALQSVPAFTWMMSDGATEYNPDKAVAFTRKMMARRSIQLGPETEKLMYYLHANRRG